MTPTCQICGTSLASGTVWCARCATPHHRDCVEFISRCSVFGCGSNRFLDEKPPEAAGAPLAGEAPMSTRRGIPGRVVASLKLIAGHPGISVAFVAMGFVPGLLGLWQSSYYLAWILDVACEATLVLYFATRARGKELGAHQVLHHLRRCGPRLLVTAAIAGYLLRSPLDAMLTMMMTGSFSRWILPASVLFFPFVVLNAFGAFAVLVAAMGPDEEPENPFKRSAKLALGAFHQVILTQLIFRGMLHGYWFWGLSSDLRGGGLEILSLGAQGLNLLMTAYWILFYLERRREVPVTRS